MNWRWRRAPGRSSGPPPIVRALLVIEAAAVIVLALLGVSLGDILKSAGPVVAVTLAFLSPTLQELGRRKPKLAVLVDGGDANGTVTASALRPWPIAEERIVANELAAARESLNISPALGMMMFASEPFAIQPSEREHAEARAAFEAEVVEYEMALREWLANYTAAARQRSLMFELATAVHNRRGGAHAEEVTLVLELSDSVTVTDDWPTVGLPPERPSYEPPRPRRAPWMQDGSGVGRFMNTPAWVASPRADLGNLTRRLLRSPVELDASDWKVTHGGELLETSIGDVHGDRSVSVREPLLLSVDGPGRHEIRWALYSKSTNRPARGKIVLAVPDETDRPRSGRLAGVTSFPDVAIVDEDGEVVHDVRTSDPPARPQFDKPDGDDLVEYLSQAGETMTWEALGLDPSLDGSQASVVRMRDARRTGVPQQASEEPPDKRPTAP